MKTLTIIRLVLGLLSTFANWANRRSQIKIGEKQEIARQTVAFLRSAGVTDEILATVINKTDEEIDASLEDRFID